MNLSNLQQFLNLFVNLSYLSRGKTIGMGIIGKRGAKHKVDGMLDMLRGLQSNGFIKKNPNSQRGGIPMMWGEEV